ncbi:HD domain-containing phosphohydrolase [Bdellovibrionota bacterium FG-2]
MTRDIAFDVFLKLSEGNFVHVFSRSSGIDFQRLAGYLQKGVSELYVRQEQWSAYQEAAGRSAQVVFKDPGVSKERKIAVLLQMTEQNMSEVFSQFEIHEETADKTKQLVRNYVEVMGQNPGSLALILRLVSQGDYLYYHSVAVSIFSIVIAKATGLFNQASLEQVGLGAFLHDIGFTEVDSNLYGKAEEALTPVELEQVRKHPALGLHRVEETPNVPEGARYIIYQHHEQPSGRGYPNGIRGNSIFYPAKIVAIADAFSSMIGRDASNSQILVSGAIRKMRERARKNGTFDLPLVKIVESVFVAKKQKVFKAA